MDGTLTPNSLIADLLRLTQICAALGYDEHYASGNLNLCHKYQGLVRGASNGSPAPAVSNSPALGVDSAQSNSPITVGAGNHEGQLGTSSSIDTGPIQTGSTIDAFTRGPQESNFSAINETELAADGSKQPHQKH